MARPLLLPASRAGSIERAVATLKAGRVVAFPTDTVYGVGAHGLLASAIQKLFEVKERERGKAIALLLARAEDMRSVAATVPEIAWRLAERFWPGPVTLIVRKAPGIVDVLTAGGDSVGVRVPANAVALTLITALGAPLAATSANLSGQKEAVTAAEVRQALGQRVELILAGGRCPGGVPSTVVDLTTAPPTIRRRGAMVDEIEAFLSQAR